jgi:hypothetical protein
MNNKLRAEDAGDELVHPELVVALDGRRYPLLAIAR